MEIEHFLAVLTDEEVVMFLLCAFIVGWSARDFHLSRFTGLDEPAKTAIDRRQSQSRHLLRSHGEDLRRVAGRSSAPIACRMASCCWLLFDTSRASQKNPAFAKRKMFK
jgi:hypothetical protein